MEVPNGVCVTAVAFRNTVDRTPTLKEAIDLVSMGSASLNLASTDSIKEARSLALDQACLKAQSSFESEVDLTDLMGQLKATLGSVYPDFMRRKFAVRSSALGEDSEDLSAAGQNSTFLGTKGSVVCAIYPAPPDSFVQSSLQVMRLTMLLNAAGRPFSLGNPWSTDVLMANQ